MSAAVTPADWWYEDRDELVAFGRALVESGEFDAGDLLAMLERPWRWSDEHAAWCAAGKPGSFELAVSS